MLHSDVETAPADSPGTKCTVLSLLVMMGTASLVDGLKWDKALTWPASDRFWRGTNMDTCAAEAMTFLNWFLVQRYHAAARSDRPTFERIGIESVSDLNSLTARLTATATGTNSGSKPHL